jgi:hypothetical protein
LNEHPPARSDATKSDDALMLRYPPPSWYEGPFFIAAVIAAVALVAIVAVVAILVVRHRRAKQK